MLWALKRTKQNWWHIRAKNVRCTAMGIQFDIPSAWCKFLTGHVVGSIKITLSVAYMRSFNSNRLLGGRCDD